MAGITYSLFPTWFVEALAKKFGAAGLFLQTLFPSLKEDLLRADYKYSAKEYAAIAFVASWLNAIVIALLIVGIGFAEKTNLIAVALAAGLLVGLSTFITIIYYPEISARKKVRRLENQLIPACRQLLIELRSGVPLFNAMNSISTGYGEVSEEFSKIVARINAGIPELDALSEATEHSPSFQFRKVLWQISNALKVGSDVGNALDGIINELTREKINEIRRYSQELNPMIMLYMMVAVVLPSLGATVLIVVISFMRIGVPKIVFAAILLILFLFELFLINFIQTRRPLVEV